MEVDSVDGVGGQAMEDVETVPFAQCAGSHECNVLRVVTFR